MYHHRRRSGVSVWLAGILGGSLGAFGAWLLGATSEPPPATRVVEPDYGKLVARIEARIDRRLEVQLARIRTAAPTKSPASGDLIRRTGPDTFPARPTGVHTLDLSELEELRRAPAKSDRITELDLHTAEPAELTRRFLFRDYGSVLRELGFPDGTGVVDGTVRFRYRYRRAGGASSTVEIIFLDGVAVSISR